MREELSSDRSNKAKRRIGSLLQRIKVITPREDSIQFLPRVDPEGVKRRDSRKRG